ncbi:transmembrane protein 135 isoform X1 [Tenebrio molitor]|uniref:transmembrane protein 135 isoform X1 n=1 Tax=Tenebrio molitor TaxID=7067 RepID=UPI0036248F80
MVIISKPLFYDKIGPEVKCKNLIHSWTDSCVDANFTIILRYLVKGVFFFYLPIYLVKIIVNHRKIDKYDKNYFKNVIKAYLKSQMYGVALGTLMASTICLSTNFTGRLYYYGIGFLPGLMSGLSIFFEHPDNRHLNTLIWLNMVVEALFNNAYHFKFIECSAVKETIIFMFASALLTHLLMTIDKKKIPINIWFYRPRSLKNDDILKDCVLEFFKYLGIGCGISNARYLISRTANLFKNPIKTIFRSLFDRNNLKFSLVFGAYAGLFRIVSYTLHKSSQSTKTLNATIAGFIAGIAYYINPTINILTIAIITALQMLCKQYLLKPKWSERIFFTELLFMVSNGFLLHNRVAAPVTCPHYYLKMLKLASGGLIDQLYLNVIKNYILA